MAVKTLVKSKIPTAPMEYRLPRPNRSISAMPGFKYPAEDIVGEILLADGTTQAVTVNFPGACALRVWRLEFQRRRDADYGHRLEHVQAGPGVQFCHRLFRRGVVFHRAIWTAISILISTTSQSLSRRTTRPTAQVRSWPCWSRSPSRPRPCYLSRPLCWRDRSVLAARLQIFAVAAMALVLMGGERAQAGEVLTGLIGGDLTNPDNAGPPNVTITAGDAANSPLTELPANVLDNSTASKWLAFQPNGTFYQVQFDGAAQHAVNTYTITSANDAPERDPYRWTLSGSNNGVNFTVVDQQSGQRFTARGQTQQFVVGNTQAYNYYRFDFLTPLGAGAESCGAEQYPARRVGTFQ